MSIPDGSPGGAGPAGSWIPRWGIPFAPGSRASTLALAALIATVAFLIFRWSPNRQVGDSKYTILLAQNLIRHGDFALERYHLDFPDYRLERVAGHDYYYFPAASSILSVPFVAAMNLADRSPVTRNGAYDRELEENLDVLLARILMGVFAAVVFLTARLILPTGASIVVTSAIAFGTQIFSTASRALWSDTWGSLLVGIAVLVLLRAEVAARRPPGALLGALTAAAYIVRPTNSLPLVGLAVYLLWHRKSLVAFAAVAFALVGAFVVYSLVHFGTLLPSYHTAKRAGFGHLPAQLVAHLFSPSRGLLICVPVVLAVTILLARFWKKIRYRRLALLGIALSAVHIVVSSGFDTIGGHCFGPRLLTGMVPWLALLGTLAVDALLSTARDRGGARPRFYRALVVASAAFLSVASVAINGIGAASAATARWNVMPVNIHDDPGRIWDWRRPQVLAPFLQPREPFPVIPARGILMGTLEADRYLGWEWGYGEGTQRWTDGGTATIRFSLEAPGPGRLQLEMKPYLGEGKLSHQRVIVSLNGRALKTWTLRAAEFNQFVFSIPADCLASGNTLRLDLPDAVSPRTLGDGGDRRRLGIAVRSILWVSDRR